jgi:two-component system LytT family response regulator
MRTVLIEDDIHQREYIASLIDDHLPQIELVGVAGSVETGLHEIAERSPDLVFLDIRLKGGTAFDILCKLNSISFKVVFITAYEEYALKAIKFNALDFILKPITIEDLRTAIDKANAQIITDLNIQLVQLHTDLMSIKNKRIILRTTEKLHLVPVKDIIRCEANRNYCTFYLNDKNRITVCNPLKEFEYLLSEHGFFRLHKSHIVNLNCVESFNKSDGGFVLLSDGTRLPVADRKKADLINEFKKI